MGVLQNNAAHPFLRDRHLPDGKASMREKMKVCDLAGLQMKLQFVGNKGDEFRSQEIAFCVVFEKNRRMSREKAIYCHVHGVNALLFIKLFP